MGQRKTADQWVWEPAFEAVQGEFEIGLSFMCVDMEAGAIIIYIITSIFYLVIRIVIMFFNDNYKGHVMHNFCTI